MDLNWNLLAQSLVIGLASGSLIALIALGYTIVYGIVEIINFAHGEVFMMGAVCAMTIVAATGVTPDSAWPALVGTAILAFVAASFFSAGINFGMDKVAYRRLRRSPRLAPLITAIGFSFILQNIGIYWIGSNTEKPNPIFAQKYRTYNVLNEWFGLDTSIRIRLLDLAVIAITIPLLIGLSWFVQKTRTGKAMRATAQDRDAAALMGIDVNRTISIAFILGGALAGAAGFIALFYNNSARFQMGFRYGLFAFTAAVLGGIGNMTGAVVGGICIGLIWALSDGFMKTIVGGWGAQWTPAVIFAVLVIVMIFRPTGLFGDHAPEKV